MARRPGGRLGDLLRRLRRLERREVRDLRRRLEETSTLVHLTLLLVLPLLVGLVTFLSNELEALSFFLFPPLASGSYMLFANPESRYASPVRFVAGLTAGAICAWIAVEVAIVFVYPDLPPTALQVDAPGAAFAIFLTGLVTWALDIEEAAAFSTALLGLLVSPTQQATFVASVFLGSSVVALVFYAWHRSVYTKRARYLYESTKGDDHVLVPMRGETPDATAMLGARLAAAHEASKVVLLDLVEAEWIAAAEREAIREHEATNLATGGPGARPPGDDASGPPPGDDGDDGDIGRHAAISEAVARLEEQARTVETRVGVPCQVVVAVDDGSPAETVLGTAAEADCDLVAVPYEEEYGSLSPFVRSLFGGDVDVLVHRSFDGRTAWREVMVPVRRASDVAHSMIDFATRLAGETGRVSVCTCIGTQRERRRADEMLADLVETFTGRLETRVSQSDIVPFLAENAPAFDLVIIGASQDRSAASRLVSPPTFERISEMESDVAIVDRH
jgi:hypothetical protein